jgi:hypothetical protein
VFAFDFILLENNRNISLDFVDFPLPANSLRIFASNAYPAVMTKNKLNDWLNI